VSYTQSDNSITQLSNTTASGQVLTDLAATAGSVVSSQTGTTKNKAKQQGSITTMNSQLPSQFKTLVYSNFSYNLVDINITEEYKERIDAASNKEEVYEDIYIRRVEDEWLDKCLPILPVSVSGRSVTIDMENPVDYENKADRQGATLITLVDKRSLYVINDLALFNKSLESLRIQVDDSAVIGMPISLYDSYNSLEFSSLIQPINCHAEVRKLRGKKEWNLENYNYWTQFDKFSMNLTLGEPLYVGKHYALFDFEYNPERMVCIFHNLVEAAKELEAECEWLQKSLRGESDWLEHCVLVKVDKPLSEIGLVATTPQQPSPQPIPQEPTVTETKVPAIVVKPMQITTISQSATHDELVNHILSLPGTTRVCELKHLNPVDTGKRGITITQGWTDNNPCNANSIRSTVDKAYQKLVISDAPITDLKDRNGKLVKGPIMQMGGIEYIEGKSSIFSQSQFTCKSVQLRAEFPSKSGEFWSRKITWLDPVWTNYAIKVGENRFKWDSQGYFIFDTLIDGISGRPIQFPTPEQKKKGVPPEVGQMRNVIQNWVLTGEINNIDKKIVERNGQTVTVYTPLLDILNSSEKRSEFIVVADIIDEEYHEIENFAGFDDSSSKNPGQFRFFCSRMTIIHMEDGSVGLNARPDNLTVNRAAYFPFLELPEEEIVLRRKPTKKGKKGNTSTTKAEAKAAIVFEKTITPTETKSKEERVSTTIPQGEEGEKNNIEIIVHTPPIEDSFFKNPEEMKEETGRFAEELKVLYEYWNNLAEAHAKDLTPEPSLEEKYSRLNELVDEKELAEVEKLNPSASVEEKLATLLRLYPKSKKDVDLVINSPFVLEVLIKLGGLASKATKLETLAKLYPGASEKELNENLANPAGPYTADLIRYYLLLCLGEDVDPYNLQLQGHKWRINNLRDLISLVHVACGGKAVSGGKDVKSLIYLKDVDKYVYLMIGGEEAFRIDTTNMKTYDSRGRAFANTIVIGKGSKIVCLGSSFSNFMHTFYQTFCLLFSANSGHEVWSNLGPSIQSVMSKIPELGVVTKDRVLDQNAAAAYGLSAVFVPVVETRFPLFTNHKWTNIGKGNGTSSIGAKAIIAKFSKKECRLVDSFEWMDTVKAAQVEALEKYSLDFHFTKGSFVVSYQGHSNMNTLAERAPSILWKIVNYLRFSAEDIVGKLAAYTFKVAKGLKRPYLEFCESAELLNPVKAGYIYYNQDSQKEGFKVKVCLAPTVVSAPGISYWLGLLEGLPLALVTKLLKNYVKEDFIIPAGALHPCNFDLSNVEGMSSAVWTQTKEADGWNYLKPDRDINLKGTGDEVLFHVQKEDRTVFDCSAEVKHELKVEGKLLWIRWAKKTTVVDGKHQLVVEYATQWTENHPKARSAITKCNYIKADERLLFNALNGNSLNGLKVDAIHLQDAFKGDVIGSILTTIGSTGYHNAGSVLPEYKELYELIKKANADLGRRTDPREPVLVIERNAILAGIYDELLRAFDEIFGLGRVWTMFDQAPTQAWMMYTLYTSKVEAGKGWVRGNVEDFPDLQNKELPKGGRWVVYHEKGDLEENVALNVLAFILDENDNPIAVAQRAKVYIGLPGLPIYNVELFESSTVKENINSSQMLFASMNALSLVIKDEAKLKEIQANLVKDGLDSILRLKLLASFSQGHTFGAGKDKDTVMQLVDIQNDGDHLILNSGAKARLLELLQAEGVNLDLDDLKANDKGIFKTICEAFKHIVFRFKQASSEHGCSEYDTYESTVASSSETTLWMPGLLAFSRLTSQSDTNQDFVARFYHNILLPLLYSKKKRAVVEALEFKVMKGVMDSLLESENSIKLGNGRKNTGAKRIGMPNIPVDREWVLKSDNTNSPYQQYIRDGVDMKAVEAGEDVYVVSNRAPLAVGPVKLLQVVVEVEEIDGENKVKRQYAIALKRDKETDANYVGLPFVNLEIDNKERLLIGPLFYELSDVQLGVDLWSINLDQGDFDGDPHYSTLLRELDDRKYLTTREMILAIQKSALGLDILGAECKSLAADHYGIKTWEKATMTLGDRLRKSMSKVIRDKDGNIVDYLLFKPTELYAYYNQQAYRIQNQAVGVMYNVYMLGDILTKIAVSLKRFGLPIPPEMAGLIENDPSSLVLITSTIYEIMLGGFDPAAIPLCDHFLDKIRGGVKIDVNAENMELLVGRPEDKEKNLPEVKGILSELGSDKRRAKEVLTLFSLVSRIYRYKTKDNQPEVPNLNEALNPADFNNWGCLALVIFEFTRGGFEGFSDVIRKSDEDKLSWKGHKAALDRSFYVFKKLKQVNHQEFINDTVALQVFDLIMDNLEFELKGKVGMMKWSESQLDFFLKEFEPKEAKSGSEDQEVALDSLDGEVETIDVESVEVVEEETLGEEREEINKEGAVLPIKSSTISPLGEEKKEVDSTIPEIEEDLPAEDYTSDISLEPEVVVESEPLTADTLEGDILLSLIDTYQKTVPTPIVNSCLDSLETLSDEQLTVLNSVFKGKHTFLCGKPGAGKSYTVGVIRRVLDEVGVGYLIVGSTGTSVMNVGGDATFNSAFGLLLGFKDKLPKGGRRKYSEYKALVARVFNSSRAKDKLKALKKQNAGKPTIVIVDEVSMLDTLLLSAVDQAVESMGIQIQWLLVGDPCQFLPVDGEGFYKDVILMDGEEEVDCPSIVNFHKMNRYELTINQRGAGDKEFCQGLDEIRMGEGHQRKIPAVFLRRLEASIKYGIPLGAKHLMYNNATVVRKNREETEKMIAKGAAHKTYSAIVTTTKLYRDLPGEGKQWYMKEIKEAEGGVRLECIFNPIEKEMTLCIGMPVMLRANIYNSDKVLVLNNGATGIVRKLGDDYVVIEDDVKHKSFRIGMRDLPVSKLCGREPGTFRQLPLHPAFAITITKSQGLTITGPIVIHTYSEAGDGRISPIKEENALLVALSRATCADNIYFETNIPGQKVEEVDLRYLLIQSFRTNMESVDWIKSFGN